MKHRIEGVELMPRRRLSDNRWLPIVLQSFRLASMLTATGMGLGLLELGGADAIRNDYKKPREVAEDNKMSYLRRMR